MTRQETVKIFALISALYPRDVAFSKADVAMVNAWTMVMENEAFEIVQAAIYAHATVSEWPPSIAQIKDRIYRMTDTPMDADVSWGLLLKVFKQYGYYRGKEAKAALQGEIWDAMLRCFGSWEAFCVDGEANVQRAHWLKMWNMYQQRQKEKLVLPPAAMNLVSRLADAMRLPEE